MSSVPGIEIVDVTDEVAFDRLPPCADGRFDHRSCDYWEDELRGAKSARPSWWRPAAPDAPAAPRPAETNPFAPSPGRALGSNPFAPTTPETSLDPSAGDDLFATPAFNPFAPALKSQPHPGADSPRKLRLLVRGQAVFGSYAKILLSHSVPVAYVQFGPLSAYPRAQQIRALYPRLPQSPLPAVITCIAATAAARRQGSARRLIDAVREDLATRGFAAIETYPDLTLDANEASAAHPKFWERCGFARVIDDERYPVMRIEL